MQQPWRSKGNRLRELQLHLLPEREVLEMQLVQQIWPHKPISCTSKCKLMLSRCKLKLRPKLKLKRKGRARHPLTSSSSQVRKMVLLQDRIP
jgi:hypothetical protein